MTVTIREENVNNYNVYIEQDKYSTNYKVGIARLISACYGRVGQIVNLHYYPTLKQAKQRYSYLKQKARKGEF